MERFQPKDRSQAEIARLMAKYDIDYPCLHEDQRKPKCPDYFCPNAIKCITSLTIALRIAKYEDQLDDLLRESLPEMRVAIEAQMREKMRELDPLVKDLMKYEE